MNPSISTPSQKEPLPLHRLDGTPQTLEGTRAERGEETVLAADGTLELKPRRGTRLYPAEQGSSTPGCEHQREGILKGGKREASRVSSVYCRFSAATA